MSLDKNELIAFRSKMPADHNFIMATWLKGLRYGSEWFSLIEQKAYFENYHRIIEAILAKPGTAVSVACLKTDPEVILGYSVLRNESTTLDWVFCKSAWRSIGIAKRLVPATVKNVTHITKTGVSIIKKHPELVFNPFK